jgi:hypothetical protein
MKSIPFVSCYSSPPRLSFSKYARNVCILAGGTAKKLSEQFFIRDKKTHVEKLLVQYGFNDFKVTILTGRYSRDTTLKCKITSNDGSEGIVSFIQSPIFKRFTLLSQVDSSLSNLIKSHGIKAFPETNDGDFKCVDELVKTLSINPFELNNEFLENLVLFIIAIGKDQMTLYLDIDDTLIHSVFQKDILKNWKWNKPVRNVSDPLTAY